MYSALRTLLFRLDPERIHDQVLEGLSGLSRLPPALLEPSATDSRLRVNAFGLRFPNPIGLAAGFDKNARAVPIWQRFGFGCVELGTVTALAQPGNPRPRLFRLPEDEALINRMGFNNDGAEVIASRLERLAASGRRPTHPVGINLGKSRAAPLEDAPADYLVSMQRLWPFADYFVINVSSPNTPGLRRLQEREPLLRLLETLTGYARARAREEGEHRPLLLKIAPDLNEAQLSEVCHLALQWELDGLIATNTTLARTGLKSSTAEEGGLSGRPLAARSLEVLRLLRAQVGERMSLISVGGIFDGPDVIERLEAGATLVQIYTGFVYGGPGLVSRLNRALLATLEARGLPGVMSLSQRRVERPS